MRVLNRYSTLLSSPLVRFSMIDTVYNFLISYCIYPHIIYYVVLE